MELHPGQSQWLTGSVQPQNILVTGNRWGKSFVSAVKLIYHAIYRPRDLRYDSSGKYRAVCASITQDQANIIFYLALRLARQSPVISQLIQSTLYTPYPTLTFGNGAVIEARSTQNRGEYLLGNDYDLFIFDEVAFETMPEQVVEEVIMMRLADREGRLDLVSTPNGKNWFYRRFRDISERKMPGYFQSGDSRQNPHISGAYLKERLTYFSEARVQQNIRGLFADSGGEILPGGHIDRAMKASWPTLSSDGGSPVCLTGWDLARKRTATVGITIEVIDGFARIVALERFRLIDWVVVMEHIRRRQERYPGRLIIDATGLGDVIAEQLRDLRPEALIFTAAVKAELLTNVELFHAREKIAYNRWELPDGVGKIWSLEDELRGARWDDNNECDALMALGLALWPLRKTQIVSPRPRVGWL